MKTLLKLSLLAGASLLGVAAFAQETFTIPNGTGSVDAAGDVDNVIVSITSTVPAYAIGGTFSIVSGDLTEVATATFASEARCRVRSSAFPTDFMDIQFTTTGSYTGTFSLTPGDVVATGTLKGKLVSPGDILTFEFFESFQDGTAGLAEQTWDNLVFTSSVFVPPTPPAAQDLGVLPVGNSTFTHTAALSEVKWYKFTLNQAVSAGRFLDIDNDFSTAISATNDTSMGLYAANGSLITTDTLDGYNGGAAFSYGTLPAWGSRSAWAGGAALANCRDGQLSPGDYYLAVVSRNGTFGQDFVVTPPATTDAGDINTRFHLNDDVAPSFAGATDLGTVSTGTTAHTFLDSPLTGKWYKFTLSQDMASPDWLDIDTEDTVNYLADALSGLTSNNDTEIGLYRADGTLVFSDDDDGSGLRSQLSFGDTVSRGTLVTGADAASAARNGRDGALTAGVYYLYVGGFNTDFNAGFPNVPTNNHRSGDVVFNFRAQVSSLARTISGTVGLQNLSSDSSSFTGTWTLLDGANNVLETGTTALDAVGNYSITVNTNSGTGYSLVMKASHWLNQLVGGLDLNSNASANFSLINGDCDGDNEVGPSDFATLTSAFGTSLGDSGYDNNADLDNDEEVGPSDFSILSANFGLSGDF